jgi:hypothetical protein
MRATVALVTSVFLIAGCADKSPSAILVPQSELTLFDDSPHALNAHLTSRNGDVLESPALSYSVTPAGIARVQAGGVATCVSNGDASVLIAGGGQSATITIACRLVASIEGPGSLRLVLGRQPEHLTLTPSDASGKRIEIAPLQLSSRDPTIVTVSGTTITPVAVGRTSLEARSGSISKGIAVAVIEVIKSEPLVLNDGNSVTYTLQQGDYELDLEIKPSDGGKTGVTVSWVGTGCPNATEAQKQSLSCHVDGTASLTVLNPSMLGLGPSVTGFINLYRAPR